MFDKLKPLPADAIIGIMAMFRTDQSEKKVDDTGHTPILGCVKRAEQEVLAREDTKTYVAIAGNPAFNFNCRTNASGSGKLSHTAGKKVPR